MQSIYSLKVLGTIYVQLDDIHLCTPSCTFSNMLGANLVRERERERERTYFLYICIYSLPTYGYIVLVVIPMRNETSQTCSSINDTNSPTNDTNISNTNHNNSKSSVDLMLNPRIIKYREDSENLDFTTSPRINIFSLWLDNIIIKMSIKSCDDHFKLYLLQILS